MAPLLDEEYINTGQVYYIYKDFPILGPQSLTAALAAECAGAQGQYWAMHHWLFSNQSAWKRKSDAAQIIQAAAAAAGLDVGAFGRCLESGEYLEEVRADAEEARKAGARGTPAFLINGRLFSGFQPWERMRSIIEQVLAEEAGQAGR